MRSFLFALIKVFFYTRFADGGADGKVFIGKQIVFLFIQRLPHAVQHFARGFVAFAGNVLNILYAYYHAARTRADCSIRDGAATSPVIA